MSTVQTGLGATGLNYSKDNEYSLDSRKKSLGGQRVKYRNKLPGRIVKPPLLEAVWNRLDEPIRSDRQSSSCLQAEDGIKISESLQALFSVM